MANAASARLMASFIAPGGKPPQSLLDLVLSPDCLRPYIVNWAEVARSMISRVHREALAGPSDPVVETLLSRAFAYPDMPRAWRRPLLDTPESPVLPLVLEKDGLRLSLFGTIATLGTPQDITLQEIRIESFFPSDARSEAVLRAAASLNAQP